MQKPSVLIVGAGALGTVAGYHLSLAGTSVTFFVRPTRLDAMKLPQLLYCYDDAQLKEYSDYRTIVDIAEVKARTFDYVLISFDGETCRSVEGTRLIRELGDAVRSTPAIVIIGGVGVRDFYRKTTGLPEDRLVEGTLGSLSYQVQRAMLPLHAPTDPAQLAKASLAYHHFPNKVGFMMSAYPAGVGRAFAAMYNRCGVSRCSVMPATLFNIMTTAFFPLTAICDLAGWPDTQAMVANKPLLSLGAASMREIIGLPQHGWIGLLACLMMSGKALAMLMGKLERDSLPLDFNAFNRFHHGGKVRAQDIQVLRHCAESGETQGQSMPALRDLLRRYEAHCNQNPAA